MTVPVGAQSAGRPSRQVPRTIICGVDDSDAAEAVVDTARWFANRLQGQLVLVHVAEVPMQEAEALMTSIRVRLGLGNVFRKLPVVALPGYSRPMISAEKYLELIDEHTYHDDRVRPSHA